MWTVLNEELERIEETIDIGNGKTIELWNIHNLVVQFLKKLALKKWKYQIFTMKENRQEKVVSNTVYLKVILVLVNRVYEKEILLKSGSQIVFMSKAIAAANKIT